jgi:hypothetical protein
MILAPIRTKRSVSNLAGNSLTALPRTMIITAGQSILGTSSTTVASDLEAEYKQIYSNVKFYRHSTDNKIEFTSMNYADNTSYQTPDQNGTYCLQFYLYPQIAAAIGKELYVVHHGIGNTGLAVEWKSTTTIGDQFNNLIFKVNQALNAITAYDGIAPSVKFLLWVQGEYDSRVQAYADAYNTNLTNNFRTKTGLTNLPVIIGKVNSDSIDAPVNPLTYANTIRTAQDAVAAASPTNIFTYDSVGISLGADDIHPNVAGEHTLASRIMTVINNNNLLV